MIGQKAYWQNIRTFYSSPTRKATRLFVESKLNYISKFLKIENNPYILDVGAGNGIFTYHLAKRSQHVIGVDISERLIKKSPCRDKLLLADAFLLPFKDNTFDIVFSSCLLHHIDNPLKVIRELVRTSRKYIILCEPNRNNPLMFLFSLAVRCERGVLKYSKNFLRNLIEEYGNLDILALDSMGAITPNLTPSCIASVLKIFDKEYVPGFYNMLIARR